MLNNNPFNSLAICPEQVDLENGVYEGRITRDRLEVTKQVCTYGDTEQLMTVGVDMRELDMSYACTLDKTIPGINILATVIVIEGTLSIHSVGFVALVALTEGRGKVREN